ncbi:MAG: hypothetical protein LBU60_05265, partial [Clostridiales bacterium]|nr:hypothetical protein [Clostridiales bacterium]
TSYSIFRRIGNGDFELLSNTTKLSYLIENEVRFTNASYYIVAYNDTQKSNKSQQVDTLISVLDSVQNIQVTVNGLNVELVWDEVEYALQYDIYRKVNYKSFEKIIQTNKTNFIDFNVSNNSTILYYIVAVRESVQSGYNQDYIRIQTKLVSSKNTNDIKFYLSIAVLVIIILGLILLLLKSKKSKQ